jgi:hypothetical protein
MGIEGRVYRRDHRRARTAARIRAARSAATAIPRRAGKIARQFFGRLFAGRTIGLSTRLDHLAAIIFAHE